MAHKQERKLLLVVQNARKDSKTETTSEVKPAATESTEKKGQDKAQQQQQQVCVCV